MFHKVGELKITFTTLYAFQFCTNYIENITCSNHFHHWISCLNLNLLDTCQMTEIWNYTLHVKKLVTHAFIDQVVLLQKQQFRSQVYGMLPELFVPIHFHCTPQLLFCHRFNLNWQRRTLSAIMHLLLSITQTTHLITSWQFAHLVMQAVCNHL